MRKSDYWFFESALSPAMCAEIIEKHSKNLYKGGTVSNDMEITYDNSSHRNSEICFFQDQDLYNFLNPLVNTANKSGGWNYDWNWFEPIQMTKYGLNQYYSWHKDAFQVTYGEKHAKEWRGKDRKLSVIISLNDSKDYKGGELIFDNRLYEREEDRHLSQSECKEYRKQGTVVVFPSTLYHKVNPVTEGTRHSLVIWCLGPPLR